MGRLRGKVIIVAGAGGIGDAVAHRFAQEGASVVLGDLNADAAEVAAQAVDRAGEAIVATQFDGSDEASVAALVRLAVSMFGKLDGFHANFADFSDAHLDVGAIDVPLEAFERTMAVNARGYLLCTRHAVPAMIEGGGGAMLYTSSGAAYGGSLNRVSYAMSKAAVNALMRHTAARYGPQGIRANAIAPGLIAHPGQFTRPAPEGVEAMREAARQRIPVRRVGNPADIAAMAVHLMSDEAGFINGQVINVDGGSVMRA